MVALQILTLANPFVNSLLIYHLTIFLSKLYLNQLARGRNLLDLCFTTHPNQVKQQACSHWLGWLGVNLTTFIQLYNINLVNSCKR